MPGARTWLDCNQFHLSNGVDVTCEVLRTVCDIDEALGHCLLSTARFSP